MDEEMNRWRLTRLWMGASVGAALWKTVRMSETNVLGLRDPPSSECPRAVPASHPRRDTHGSAHPRSSATAGNREQGQRGIGV